MDQSSLTEESTRKKPGPQAKPKIDIEALQSRIHNLEQLIIRMAHNQGVAHALIKQAGLEPYEPTRNDMSRFKVV